MNLLRAADREVTPWKNGGGRTWQIATDSGAADSGLTGSGATDSGILASGASDPGATDPGTTDSNTAGNGFGWRVSVAEIAADGPFSVFPRVQRTIAVIDGAGVELTIDGVARTLAPFVPLTFPGEAITVGHLLDGTTLDLNLMVGQGFAGMMEFVVPNGEDPELIRCAPGETVLVIAVDAGLDCDLPGSAVTLDRFDAVRVTGPAELILTGNSTGRAAVIRIRPAGG
ncbi:HutD family protein [Nakamurella silvestris]|nr:HutD family protein [Nakamurella silvestris]